MANPNLPINFRKNTYIGARYVPKFAEPVEWDNSKTYEPLEIVTYQGSSYTSKTFVPVGVNINNSTYWVNTGNYNSQIEQYREEVLKVQNDVNEIENDLENVENIITDLPKKPLINFVKQNLGIVIIGDSYTTEYEKDGQTITPWTENFKRAFSNADFYINSVGGASIGSPGVSGRKAFDELLTAILPTITDKNSITHVLIVSGGNEIYVPQTNVQTGFNNITSIVNSNFPNAQIHLFNCGVRLGENREIEDFNITSRFLGYGASRGWVVHEHVYKCLVNTYLLCSDGVHPNNPGMSALSNTILNCLQNGEGFYQESLVFPISGGLVGYQWQSEDGIKTQLKYSLIEPSSPIPIVGAQWITVGTCNQQMVTTSSESFVAPIIFKTTDNNFQTHLCRIRLSINNFVNGGQSPTNVQIRLCNPFTDTGSVINFQATQINFDSAQNVYNTPYRLII